MSKFFSETQKAHQWAQQQLASRNLDIKQVLDTLKQGNEASLQMADERLRLCRKVHVGNGGHAPLISHGDESAQAALESYRALRTRLMRMQATSGQRSIAVSSPMKGDGKTLTVLNLALCYSQLPDLRVLLVDADLRTRGLTKLLGYPASPGLGEVLTGQATPEQAILATEHKNLFAISAGSASTSPPELFTGSHWQEFLGWCGESFKLILVDSPPILQLADFELISAGCDGVMLVVRARHTQREILRRTAGALDPRKLMGIVFNATENVAKSYYSYGYR